MTTSSDSLEQLTLKSLRTLLAAARSGSLTRAAVEIGLAQSAVSRQIVELEHALGGALFHRTGRGVKPTALAQQLLPRVEALLSGADELVKLGKEHTGIPSGTVTIGMVPGVAGFMAAALYGEVARLHPEIRLRVIEGYSGDMEVALSQGRIDMALLNRYRAQGTNSYRKLLDAQICVVGRRRILQRALSESGSGVARSHLPASITLAVLAPLPLVLPVPPNATRTLLDEQARRHGLHLNVILEGSSSVILKSMLEQHDCVTTLPRHAISEELRHGTLGAVALAERIFRQHVVLATSTQRPFTLASKAVAALASQIAVPLLARRNSADQEPGA
ncbi:LysR family transcriptional regulator [Ramlibacter alkalitolerans]|uniref:LysR family transcriptional regulator n=1 Tax=Ramlibacter alkalitolerans TaxID=2039631 RepID=A0ABS1JQ43_9BURK|nr:LysR family transcriptional regulator [Ramlibacter alkalitolerans]MBL0426358.1 LysR family transcriptional regulator [Ramlibacter alkalitolerans]